MQKLCFIILSKSRVTQFTYISNWILKIQWDCNNIFASQKWYNKLMCMNYKIFPDEIYPKLVSEA